MVPRPGRVMREAIRAHLTERTGRGVADAVSAAIRAGELRDGDRLPPIRSLAEELQVSPTTVSAAWSLLARAGTIATDGRRGTRVASATPRPSRYRRALESGNHFALDLSTGIPDPELLPDLAPALHALPGRTRPSGYLDDPVLPGLAAVLRRTWPNPVESLTVVDGAMDALQLITQTHLRFGDVVLVENPTFPPILDVLDSVGAVVHGVAVDEHGVEPDALSRALTRFQPAMLILQPRGQNPTGASITARRARELVRVLAEHRTMIVEDDATGDVATADAVSLGARLPDRVLHIRSFSKSLGPDLRLAAIGGAAAHLDPVVDRRLLGQGWSSRLLQALLLSLLTDATITRQVGHARREYARRRDALATRLRGHGVDVSAPDGFNLWLPVLDEAAAMVRLASRGIGVASGSPFTVHADPDHPHVRVTLASLAGDHDRVAGELAAAATVGNGAGFR